MQGSAVALQLEQVMDVAKPGESKRTRTGPIKSSWTMTCLVHTNYSGPRSSSR